MESTNQLIEKLLQRYKPVLGNDYDKYRNHVYRVFLNCLLTDSNTNNKAKYAIAAVFHDIGIWTNHTFDYLDKSVEQVRSYLEETGQQAWLNEIVPMIQWHHKITSYHGPHEAITENFRQADWIDVSWGLMNFGKDKKKTREIRRQFLNKGFHLFLLKKIIQNLFRHPLDPLPMVKK